MPDKPKKKLSARGPGRLSAAEAEALPDRLLDSAFALFNAHGYAGTTMEQIAKHAGASTKTIYSRYANKGEIMIAVARRLIEATIVDHQAATQVDPRQSEPHAFLSGFGARIARRIIGEGAGLSRLALAEGYRFPELQQLTVLAATRTIAPIAQALAAWRAQGLLPKLAAQEIELAAPLVLGMMVDRARIFVSLGAPMTAADVDAHVDYAARVFLRSYGYETPKPAK